MKDIKIEALHKYIKLPVMQSMKEVFGGESQVVHWRLVRWIGSTTTRVPSTPSTTAWSANNIYVRERWNKSENGLQKYMQVGPKNMNQVLYH